MIDVGFSVMPSLVGGWGGEPLHAKLWGLRLMEHLPSSCGFHVGVVLQPAGGGRDSIEAWGGAYMGESEGEASIISALMHCQNSGRWYTKYVPRSF